MNNIPSCCVSVELWYCSPVCVCAETAAVEAVPQGPFDVAISATNEDGALAEFIKGESKLWFVSFH